LQTILEERDEEIENLQKNVNEANDAHLRKAAELENYRKRVKRDRSQIYETAKVNALEDFLSISDDLSRTLEASNELDVNETFLEGVTLVSNKFDEVLKKHGVERIDEVGVPFNVDLHDALMRKKPEDDSFESDHILKIVENGYKIGDRTIRHAKVIVSE
jgi:molecular chaperone GrpE